MLRLPQFSVERPATLEAALGLLAAHAGRALPIAGGTDLLPNLKHRLAEPELLISLAHVTELSHVTPGADGSLVIGATTPLDVVANHPEVIARAPALAQAAGLVASPQIRRMGTLGGNVMLDTRCRYINQTHFWRQTLGFCLKKDGSVCHVVSGGQKCVAAASNDTAPALMTLGGELVLRSQAGGERRMKVDELWKTDGVFNKKTRLDELVGSVPGEPNFSDAVAKVSERAFQQCHPLPNIPGDPEYRREMVPVYVRRTLRAAVGLGERPLT